MPQSTVTITRSSGGLGRSTPNTDGITGLVMNFGTLAPAGLASGVSVRLLSLKQAENLGITKAYDATQSVLCWYHISEFFRRNPSGVLWLLLVPMGIVQQDICNPASGFAKKLLADANGEIKQLGVALNPPLYYNPIIANGLDADVTLAIQQAQALVVSERANHRPIHVFLEGRSFSGNAASLLDLRNLTAIAPNQDAPNVSVLLAQDPDIGALNSVAQKSTAMGTLLGDYSRAAVQERTDWPEQFTGLQAALPQPRFVKIGLSGGFQNNQFSNTDLDTIIDRGYICMVKHTDVPGVYWSGAGCCAAKSSDYYCVPNNRVINKAERLVYAVLVPKLNRPLLVSSNGQLAPEVVASFSSTAATTLRKMQADGEISSFGRFYALCLATLAVFAARFGAAMAAVKRSFYLF